jgi:hypothetical protein
MTAPPSECAGHADLRGILFAATFVDLPPTIGHSTRVIQYPRDVRLSPSRPSRPAMAAASELFTSRRRSSPSRPASGARPRGSPRPVAYEGPAGESWSLVCQAPLD